MQSAHQWSLDCIKRFIFQALYLDYLKKQILH
jgi:hypothetical protein